MVRGGGRAREEMRARGAEVHWRIASPMTITAPYQAPSLSLSRLGTTTELKREPKWSYCQTLRAACHSTDTVPGPVALFSVPVAHVQPLLACCNGLSVPTGCQNGSKQPQRGLKTRI